MIENIFDQAKKYADEVEVFVVSSEVTPVQFEANRLKHIQSKQSTSVALRIIRQGRIGYATATDLADSQNLVNAAIETAQFGMKAEFEFPSFTSYPSPEIFDPDIEAVTTEEMTRLGETMISKLRNHTPELLCESSISKGVVTVHILNSRGGQMSYKQSTFSMGIEGQLIRGTDMLFIGESQSSCHPILESNEITEVALKQLEFARNQASVASGSLPVIFTPQGVASALTSPLMSAFNGKTVLEGASPIGNRLDQQVFDEKLSLWDDPTVTYRPASRPCDDECVPSQCTKLIEKGTISNFLYDLQTAALAKTKSTGNGARGGGQPAPAPSAFVITPGETTFDEMVSDIKEGLVVEYLMGAGQGNVLGGDFSGNVLLGYKVESGKIVGRVKDTMVSGNIHRLLKQTAAIGSDVKWVGGFLNTPSLYFSSVSVASN